MYSAYKLNKQGDNIQPWRTAFPIWNQFIVPCPVLTVASWPAYRFLKRLFHSFFVIHTVKGFGIVKKAEIDIFLELSYFFHDPMDVGNLISDSSAFSKTSLNIWKFTVHVLLKPGLDFIYNSICQSQSPNLSLPHPYPLVTNYKFVFNIRDSVSALLLLLSC